MKRCDVQYSNTNACNPHSDPKVSIKRDRELDERAVREAIEARAKRQEKSSNHSSNGTDNGHGNHNSNSNSNGKLDNSNGNSNSNGKQQQVHPSRKRKVACMSTTGPWSMPKSKYRTIWDPAGESDSSSKDNDYC